MLRNELHRYFKKVIMKKSVLLISGLFLCLLYTLADGYKIDIRLKDFPSDTIVIGHRFNASFVPKDTVILNQQGEGVFSGSATLPQGMYLIYLPNDSFFDLLISEDQEFYVENDTLDFVNHIVIKGSEENSAFYGYQQYLQKQSIQAKQLQEKLKSQESDIIAASKTKEELNRLNEEVMDHINQLITEYDGTFFGKFLLSLQEVKVPDPPRDENGNIIDSTFQYKYY